MDESKRLKTVHSEQMEVMVQRMRNQEEAHQEMMAELKSDLVNQWKSHQKTMITLKSDLECNRKRLHEEFERLQEIKIKAESNESTMEEYRTMIEDLQHQIQSKEAEHVMDCKKIAQLDESVKAMKRGEESQQKQINQLLSKLDQTKEKLANQEEAHQKVVAALETERNEGCLLAFVANRELMSVVHENRQHQIQPVAECENKVIAALSAQRNRLRIWTTKWMSHSKTRSSDCSQN